MLSELKAVYDLIEKLAVKKRLSNEEKVFNKVIATMYTMGGNGSTAVSQDQIEIEGISKMEIFRAIERADFEDMLIGCNSFGTLGRWMLNPKGVLYVEALLSENS